LLYRIIKPFIRIALYFFFRKIHVSYSTVYDIKGPVLITANHPNSFLDAILIGAYFKKPIHFLARGDAFKKPVHRFLLGLLNMIPIYRLSEGKENLYLNEYAFKASQKVLQNEGIVLIFIEGICLLTNQLQPFKKGAARIALDYEGKKPLQILPLGIAYNRFNTWGSTVQIIPGKPLKSEQLFPFNDRARNMRHFNEYIQQDLNPLINVPENEKPAQGTVVKFLGQIGYVLHRGIFHWLNARIISKTSNTVFHDSVLFAALLLFYPILIVIIGACAVSLFGWLSILPLLLLTIMARCIVLVKNPNE